MTRTNNVVIAHEILHTLGASDKYDLERSRPCSRSDTRSPNSNRCHPQTLTEVMAGRYAIDSRTFEMPAILDEVLVGAATALEIGWTHP